MKLVIRIIGVVLVLAVIGAIVYKILSTEDKAKQARLQRRALPVDMLVVQSAPFTETLEVTGSIEANEEVTLTGEVSGKITGIFFEEGQAVPAGKTLVKIYDNDLQAQLKKAEANLQLTKEIEQRQKQLLEREAISQQEYDQAYANLNAAEADVELLKSQISKTEIKAPFAGRIGFRKVSPGAYITPGTVIAGFVKDNPVKIQFSVPEKYASLIGVGSTLTYKPEGQATEKQAKVYAVAPGIDASTRTLQLKAWADNSNGKLLPGAFTRVSVNLSSKANVIMVPTSCLISETRGEKLYLYKNKLPQEVFVTTGSRTNDAVEILSGVAVGDTLITTGLMQITPRTEVIPNNL